MSSDSISHPSTEERILHTRYLTFPHHQTVPCGKPQQPPNPAFSPSKALLICLELCDKIHQQGLSPRRTPPLDSHTDSSAPPYVAPLAHLSPWISHVILPCTEKNHSSSLQSGALINLLNGMGTKWKQASRRFGFTSTAEPVLTQSESVSRAARDGSRGKSTAHNVLPPIAFAVNETHRVLFCCIHLNGQYSIASLDSLRDFDSYLLPMDMFDEFLDEGYRIIFTGHSVSGLFALKVCLNLRHYANKRSSFAWRRNGSLLNSNTQHSLPEAACGEMVRCITFGTPFAYDFPSMEQQLDLHSKPLLEWELNELQQHPDAFWNYYTEQDILPWLYSYRTFSDTEEGFYHCLDLILNDRHFTNPSSTQQRIQYLRLLQEASPLELMKLISSVKPSLKSLMEHKPQISRLLEQILSQSKMLLPNREPVGRCFISTNQLSSGEYVKSLELLDFTRHNIVSKTDVQDSLMPLLANSSMDSYYQSYRDMIQNAYGRHLFKPDSKSSRLEVAERFLPRFTWMPSLHTPSPMSPSSFTFKPGELKNRLIYYVLRTPMQEKSDRTENKVTIHSSELNYVLYLQYCSSEEFSSSSAELKFVRPVSQSNQRLVFVFITDTAKPLCIRLHTLFGCSEWKTVSHNESVMRPMLKGKILSMANMPVAELIVQGVSFSLLQQDAVDASQEDGKSILHNRAECKMMLFHLEEIWKSHLQQDATVNSLSREKRYKLHEEFSNKISRMRSFTHFPSEEILRNSPLDFVPLSHIFQRFLSEGISSEEKVRELLLQAVPFSYFVEKQIEMHLHKRRTLLQKTLMITGLNNGMSAFSAFGASVETQPFTMPLEKYSKKLTLLAEDLMCIDLSYVREHPFFLEEAIVNNCSRTLSLNSDRKIASKWNTFFPNAKANFLTVDSSEKMLILKVIRSIVWIHKLRLEMSKLTICGMIGTNWESLHSLWGSTRPSETIFRVDKKGDSLLQMYRVEEMSMKSMKQQLDSLVVESQALVDCIVVVCDSMSQEVCSLVESYQIPTQIVVCGGGGDDGKRIVAQHATVSYCSSGSGVCEQRELVRSWIQRTVHAFGM